MLKSSRWRRLCLLASLSLFVLALAACGGGGGGGGTTDNGVKKAAVSGQVSFPALSALVAKQVADATVPADTIIPPVMIISDLDGKEIMRPALVKDPSDSSGKSFRYSASLDSNKNYLFRTSWGGQVLRALADKSALSALTADIKITPVSTATVLVVEKSLALPPGTLGTSNATPSDVQNASASLAALPPATIETNITDAVTACTSASGTPTSAQAELASLASVVEAVIKTKADAAVFMADTTSTTTVNAVTYSQSGTPVNAVIAPADVVNITSTVTASLPKITSPNSATFTVGTAGSFTVTGNGTLSVWGTLPSGVTFDTVTGVLSGTPAAGSNGTYPVTFTASSNGIEANQKFTLTVNAPVPVFTTAMIADKEFDVSYNGGSFHYKINADGSFWKGVKNGTWSINSSGQLVVAFTGETDTLTVVSATSSTIVVTFIAANSDGSTSSGTLTLTESTGGGSPTTPATPSNTLKNFTKDGLTFQDYPLRMTISKDTSGNFIATGSRYDFHKDATTGAACTYNGDPNCIGIAGNITAVAYNGATITLTGEYDMVFTGVYSNGIYSGLWSRPASGTESGAFSVDVPTGTTTPTNTGSVTAYW